jgi:hypothetical protein
LSQQFPNAPQTNPNMRASVINHETNVNHATDTRSSWTYMTMFSSVQFVIRNSGISNGKESSRFYDKEQQLSGDSFASPESLKGIRHTI